MDKEIVLRHPLHFDPHPAHFGVAIWDRKQLYNRHLYSSFQSSLPLLGTDLVDLTQSNYRERSPTTRLARGW